MRLLDSYAAQKKGSGNAPLPGYYLSRIDQVGQDLTEAPFSLVPLTTLQCTVAVLHPFFSILIPIHLTWHL
jgi:hypothetical protein